MSRLTATLALIALAAAAVPAAAQSAGQPAGQPAGQSGGRCFSFVAGDPSGWGSVTRVCPQVDRPRDPRPVRLR